MSAVLLIPLMDYIFHCNPFIVDCRLFDRYPEHDKTLTEKSSVTVNCLIDQSNIGFWSLCYSYLTGEFTVSDGNVCWSVFSCGPCSDKYRMASAASITPTMTIYAVQPLPAPIQGKADWRSFRCFQLQNGVTVCLVHDKESKTTAAAATVNVGAAADPREMPGLART
jgi:hypothetical protein